MTPEAFRDLLQRGADDEVARAVVIDAAQEVGLPPRVVADLVMGAWGFVPGDVCAVLGVDPDDYAVVPETGEPFLPPPPRDDEP